MVVGEPMIFYMRNYNASRELSKTIPAVFRGIGIIKQSISAFLVYPLYSQNDGGIRRAFFIKPYGVDYADFKLNYTFYNKKVIAEIEYPELKTTKLVDVTSQTENMATNRLILPLHNINYLSDSNLSAYSVPSKIRFYIEDSVSGVRSESSTSVVKLAKRRINSAICYLIEKK